MDPEVEKEVFLLGELVQVKDTGDQNWRQGVVASLRPTKVKVSGWKKAYEWDQIRKVNFFEKVYKPINATVVSDQRK